MNKKVLALRLTAAIATGLAASVFSLLVMWRQSPETLMTNPEIVRHTGIMLRIATEDLIEYMRHSESPPRSIDELYPPSRDTYLHNRSFYGRKLIQNGVPMDGWGRPLLYSVEGTTYTLMSYGRDGKPGGTGFDQDQTQTSRGDVYDDRALLDPPMPSLHQFVFELPAGGMLKSCAISGVLAFLLTLILLRPSKLSKEEATNLVVRIAATLGATIVFALVIMQLHIPTGH